ncbi:TetR/AcrR family transcriptional regulator [Stenotrophomonas rhizophila]|uniref:TetR/AcrR family transcriptional regulator n=1 Tax=Stenotrophomonas rhizophila TaxID=216778 RepID=UPI000EB48322|nr:TetR/AcrR family transcriptional regulator [Stenotrophomonas rhizophila]
MDTKKTRPRGRPRIFDPDAAIGVAQRLFHERGYDGVSVADITSCLGINPPSFYAAFGSKACLFSKALCKYEYEGAIPLQELLDPDRPVIECLAAVLEEAACRYAGKSGAAGCLVIEGAQSNDHDAKQAASEFLVRAEEAIRDFVAARHPDAAYRVTDYISTVMIGLSANARRGQEHPRLLNSARLAAQGLDGIIGRTE